VSFCFHVHLSIYGHCNLRELFHIFPPFHITYFFKNVVETCGSTLVFNISCYSCYFLLLFQSRNVWLDAQILLSLWHVRKAWVENVVRKIVNPQKRSNILSAVGRIMYSRWCPIDVDLIFLGITRNWNACNKFSQCMAFHSIPWRTLVVKGENVVCSKPQYTTCKAWHKFCGGSFHNNLKRIFYFSQEKLTRRQMD
jgi:hypothetical protein